LLDLCFARRENTMKIRLISAGDVSAFEVYLYQQEKSSLTREKYIRDVKHFLSFAKKRSITKELTVAYREISEWVRSTWWQPLNVKRINCFLKDTHRKRMPIIY
jgi:site-specific recombinase XerD